MREPGEADGRDKAAATRFEILKGHQKNAALDQNRIGRSHLLVLGVLWDGMRTRQGLRQEKTPEEADTSCVQAVHPQRGGEDPRGKRQIRRQDHKKLRAI